MAITAIFNTPHPDRLQLLLGNLVGPLVSPKLGQLDPRRDLGIYINGVKTVPVSFSFDATNNRYLMYFDHNISFDPTLPVIQVIHHIPKPPFISLVQTNPALANVAPGQTPDILPSSSTGGG